MEIFKYTRKLTMSQLFGTQPATNINLTATFLSSTSYSLASLSLKRMKRKTVSVQKGHRVKP